MQAFLLNFGDNSRVVNDSQNAAVMIGIGKIVEADIHDVHFHMIRRAVSTETLMVVPKDIRMTPELKAIMDLLRGIETEPYDDLLAAFFAALPPPGLEEGSYRPTRDQIRLALREGARKEVAAALKLQAQVTIREEGTPELRKKQERLEDEQIERRNRENMGPPKVKKQEGPAIKKKTAARSSAKETSKPAKRVTKTKIVRERF